MHAFQNTNWCSPKSDWRFFFWLWLSESLSIGRILSDKKIWRHGINFWENGSFVCSTYKKREATTSSYSATGDFLYIYSVLVAKNYQEIRFRCLVHKFSFTDVFKRYYRSYGAAILKENPLWLLPFYMAMATSCYYENVRRMMRTAIVSYLFKLSRQAEIQHLLYLT